MKKIFIGHHIFVLLIAFYWLNQLMIMLEIDGIAIKACCFFIVLTYFLLGNVFEYENRMIINAIPGSVTRKFSELMNPEIINKRTFSKLGRAFYFGIMWPLYVSALRKNLILIRENHIKLKKGRETLDN